MNEVVTPAYRLVVFDWDGTLVDSEGRIVTAVQASIRDLGEEMRSHDQVRNIIGLGLREAIEALYPQREAAFTDRFVASYRHYFLERHTEPSPLFPHVRSVLDELRERGHWLAVATGKSRAGLDREMQQTGLGEYFLDSRCADETRSKPHPQMLEELMDAFGVEPHETLMVGDTEYDLEMAEGAGAGRIGVAYGVHGCARLQRFAPLACLQQLSELPGLLPAQS